MYCADFITYVTLPTSALIIQVFIVMHGGQCCVCDEIRTMLKTPVSTYEI